MASTIGLYFSISQDEANALRDRLNKLAYRLGFMARRGPTAGEGNLAALLQAIDSGVCRVERVQDWGCKRVFTAAEVRQAAQEALDEWDFDAESPHTAAGLRHGLECIRDNQDAPLELDRAYSDIWDYFYEIGLGYAAEMR